MPGERQLGPLALDFLWEALGAGELPYPLEVRSHGETMDERTALRRRVREDLIADGLIDHRGRLEPELEDWFGTLAQADLSIDSVFLPELNAPPVVALAATGRAGAVLAVQHQHELRLRGVPRDGLVSAIVGMLPPAPRGTEQSISIPADEVALVSAGGRRTSDAETRKALAKLTGMPNRRGGQIAANSRSDMRGRRRSPVLSWFDNETGRYLTSTRDGWATFAPTDAATLRHRVGEMVREVTSDRR